MPENKEKPDGGSKPKKEPKPDQDRGPGRYRCLRDCIAKGAGYRKAGAVDDYAADPGEHFVKA